MSKPLTRLPNDPLEMRIGDVSTPSPVGELFPLAYASEAKEKYLLPTQGCVSYVVLRDGDKIGMTREGPGTEPIRVDPRPVLAKNIPSLLAWLANCSEKALDACLARPESVVRREDGQYTLRLVREAVVRFQLDVRNDDPENHFDYMVHNLALGLTSVKPGESKDVSPDDPAEDNKVDEVFKSLSVSVIWK